MKVKLVIQLGGDAMRTWGDVAALLERSAVMLRDQHGLAAEPGHGDDCALRFDGGKPAAMLEIVTDKEA